MFLKGCQIDTERGVRAGVIPFTIVDKQLYFLLGIDRATQELCDFGGGVKLKETIVDGAFREFHEESCCIFTPTIDKNCLLNSLVIVDHKRTSAIFFLFVHPQWLHFAERSFNENQQRLKVKKYNELRGVIWMSQLQFARVVFDRRNQCMWKRIRNMLRYNTNWKNLRMHLLRNVENQHRFKFNDCKVQSRYAIYS